MGSRYHCAACGAGCGMMGHGPCSKGEENASLLAAGKARRWHFGYEIPSEKSVREILSLLDLDPEKEQDLETLRKAVVLLHQETVKKDFEASAFDSGD